MPGKPEKSPLVERIFSKDKSEVMPPHKTNKTLTAAEKETLKQLDRRGSRVSAALVVHPADAADTASREEQGLGAQPDRPLHPGQA